MFEAFDAFLVRPVFNLLELIYAVIPGHDLGVAIILFTILVRLALWPLVHKQLHHAKAMRRLQPELKKLKKEASGDRQQEARLQMELYKERGIKPLASIGTLIIQIPIFIALYQGILKIINDPKTLISFSYDSVRNLPWIQELAKDISKFDDTFLSLVDLTRRGVEGGEGLYVPAIILALVSTFVQYKQTKLMMQSSQDARKLSVILKDAASGKEADQSEVTAAVSRIMLYFLPFVTFIFALIVPSALSLYLLTSSAVGYLQQKRVLGQDAEEMHQIASEPSKAEQKKVAKTRGAKTKAASIKNNVDKKVIAPGVTVSIRTANEATTKPASKTTKTKNKQGRKRRRKR
jgi:YidC/Oxa1 family membrane protein insertase